MRLTRIIMAILLVSLSAGNVFAQLTAEQKSEAEKAAKQEVKRLTKEGWKVPVGGLPMEMQLTKSYQYQMDIDDFAQPKYIFGQSTSGGSFYDAAKMQAQELAKSDIAGNLSTEITRTVNIMLENKQISQAEAQSCSNIIQRGVSSSAQRLYSVIPLIEIYRDRKGGGVEVLVRLAYNKKKAMDNIIIDPKPEDDSEDPSLIAASQYIMAEHCFEEKDYEKAEEWCEKAERLGSPKAKGLLAKIREKINGKPTSTVDWLSESGNITSPTYQMKIGIKSESKIEDVDITVNGKKFRGISAVKNDGYDMTVKETLTLEPGNNTIKIKVKNTDGTTTVEKEIVYSPNGPDPKPEYRDDRIALIIGNSNYQDTDKSLTNPKNDATDLAAKLRTLGFEVMLLIDADRKAINNNLYEFGEKAKKYDTALFYYAGHGIQSKGVNYLVPIDAELKAEDDIQYNCVNANQVLDKMELCKAKIIILDACRNNPFERSWHRGSSTRGLSMMTAPEGCFIAYATNPGNVAQDGKGRNSPYTDAMLKTLDKPNLSLENFFKEVLSEVKRSTKGTQTPWISSSFEGDFYFNKK